jgi:hypothetical protein
MPDLAQAIVARSAQQEDFINPAAATLHASTYTGSVYQAFLPESDIYAGRHTDADTSGDYLVRPASNVTINGEVTSGAFIGYSFAGSTLLVLDAEYKTIRRSSTVADLTVTVV